MCIVYLFVCIPCICWYHRKDSYLLTMYMAELFSKFYTITYNWPNICNWLPLSHAIMADCKNLAMRFGRDRWSLKHGDYGKSLVLYGEASSSSWPANKEMTNRFPIIPVLREWNHEVCITFLLQLKCFKS